MVCRNRVSGDAKTAKFCMKTAFFVIFALRKISENCRFPNSEKFSVQKMYGPVHFMCMSGTATAVHGSCGNFALGKTGSSICFAEIPDSGLRRNPKRFSAKVPEEPKNPFSENMTEFRHWANQK